jgi:6-pyruvoyltetrahydropterin/6-carboxytetrahydropterin synthase
MSKFQSTKLFDGFSCVFRQWRAEGTHCKYIHGYGISFRIWFEGELDERNWIWDFGHAKRSQYKIDDMNPKAWMDYMFDHTMLIAEDDPYINAFKEMDRVGVAQVRIVPAVGCEKFAEYIYNKLNPWVLNDSNERVKITQVEVREHEKNTALYIPAL